MAARKRILYYNHTRQVSGGERMLLMMLQVLDRERYEPVCACPFAGKGNLDETLRALGERVVEAPVLQARFTSNPVKLAGYLASFWKAVRAFRRTIAAVRPDLLHANSVRAGIVATLATLGTGTMVLWHIQDDLPVHPISRAIRQLAFRSARSRFVAVSHATARVFAGGLPFGFRLQVLHNAVDVARFPRKTRPLDAEAQAFRDEVRIEDGKLLVVAVGMINPRKGLMELVQAWAVFVHDLDVPQASEMRLALVGAPIFNNDQLYAAELKRRIEELGLAGKVILTGPRPNVPAIFRAADLAVLNAATEPFGLVLLEAMSSGTAVLATKVGGISEIVGQSVSGLLVSPPGTPNNERELTQALLHAAVHPETLQSLADAAVTEVLPQFTIPVFAANLQALYTGLTRPGRSDGI